jgi:hypothetical protein
LVTLSGIMNIIGCVSVIISLLGGMPSHAAELGKFVGYIIGLLFLSTGCAAVNRHVRRSLEVTP